MMRTFLVLSTFFLSTLCSQQSAPYPCKSQIADIFSSLSSGGFSYQTFFGHVSPTVKWTIEGTHPAAGTYTNRTVLEATFARISALSSKQDPFKLSVVNIIGGCQEEWSVEELQILGTCKNGLVFDNRYAWATRWNKDSVIVEARAYLDSALVSTAIQQNEIAVDFTYSDARNAILPFTSLTEDELKGTSGFERDQSNKH